MLGFRGLLSAPFLLFAVELIAIGKGKLHWEIGQSLLLCIAQQS